MSHPADVGRVTELRRRGHRRSNCRMTLAALGPWSKLLILKNFMRDGERTRTAIPITAIQMPAIVVARRPAARQRRTRMRHGRTNFAGQPSIRIRILEPPASAARRDFPFRHRLRVRRFQVSERTGSRRRGLSRRFRITLAGDRERLVEILGIEPFLGAQAFQHAVFPQPGGLDIELALLLLIAAPACRSR